MRGIDPGIVAAGLAAAAAGATTFPVSVLLRCAAAQLAAVQHLGTMQRNALSYLVSVRGDITTAAAATAEWAESAGTFFVPARLTIPVPPTADAAAAPWPPAWSLLGRTDVVAEASPNLRATLDFSIPAIHALPRDLPALPTLDGRGVVMGVVDWGCDFAHPAFRDSDGQSRIHALWDQNGAAPSGGLKLGTAPPVANLPGVIFTGPQLDAALAAPDPYWAAGYDPAQNSYDSPHPYSSGGDTATEVVHGTHVLGTASGSASDVENIPGVAPGCELMFVHLRPNALDAAVPSGNGNDVVQAVAYICHTAATQHRPCVVNLSLGNNSGPHDGSSLLEQVLDALASANGRAIVVPAGNSHDAALHASGVIRKYSPRTLTWRFADGDTAANIVDIWYETPTAAPCLTVSLQPPQGTALAQPDPAIDLLLSCGDDQIGSVLVESRSPAQAGGTWLQHVRIALTLSGNPEAWGITLALADAAAPATIEFHAWIDRSDAAATSQSQFAAEDADPHYTLDSLSCGHHTLCVGAYYEVPPGQPAAFFSSAGPTRDGRQKPDVAAPGFQVQAPCAKGGRLIDLGQPDRVPMRIAMSGTSVSAPHVAGLAALLLQMRPDATAAQLREWIVSTTQSPSPGGAAEPAGPRRWNPQLGYGRIDAAAAVAAAT